MEKTFFSFSFGCRVNQAEKEMFDREMSKLGYAFTETDPYIYIINTCSVTNKAEREARQLIYKVKRNLPSTKIVVTGCAATNWIKQGIKIYEADYIIDNKNKEYVASIIDKQTNGKKIAEKTQVPPINKYVNSGRMIIKIQDGCQRFCSFCIVPYLRGLPVSRKIDEIVGTINAATDLKESILVAINTEAYGYDTKESFTGLINAVLKKTGVPRLSFGSVHPWSVNDEFIKWYGQENGNSRLVKFFHIPLQSGSNKILKLMKRGYTREEYIEKLLSIEKINPFTFIGTDIITGFLEENEQDFEDTYSFLEQTPISKFHVFRYSDRTHTAAHYMAKRLIEPTSAQKSTRSKKLIALGEKKYINFLKKHIGRKFNALFLEKREENLQHALLDNQIPVLISSAKPITGEIKPVEIKSCKNGRLFGKIV